MLVRLGLLQALQLGLEPLVLLEEKVPPSLQVRDDILQLSLVGDDTVVVDLPPRSFLLDLEDHLVPPLVRLVHLVLGLCHSGAVHLLVFLSLPLNFAQLALAVLLELLAVDL